jgi:uncharacterized membrane protein
MNGNDMSVWGWAGMTFMTLIAVAILALVWIIARRVGEPRAQTTSAREQLDARLARGEIAGQEYRERLEALQGHHIDW